MASPQIQSGPPRLSFKTKIAFGSGAAAEAAAGIAFNTFNFLFYNQVLGLSGKLSGLAVAVALILDAIADPFVGSLSDRLRSKYGRRHPFMYAAAIPMGVSFYLIYAPPVGLSEWGLFAWFTFFYLAYRQSQTLYHVPHLALGAELSDDYRERSVVMAYNALLGVVGGAGAFFFAWTTLSNSPGGSGARENYEKMAMGVAIFVTLTIFISAWFTRDRIPYLKQNLAPPEPFSLRAMLREIKDCLSNKNYRYLLLGLIFISITTGTRETLGAHMSLFFWGLEEKSIRVFGLASPPGFIIAFIVAARWHAKYDKRSAIIFSTILVIIAANVPVLLRLTNVLPHNGAKSLIPILMFFVFLFYTAVALLVISVLSALADIADEHELATGRRQEGVFFAARTFFAQVTTGVGHIVAGWAMDIIGFPQGAKPGEVPEDVVWKLGIIDGPLVAIPAIIAAVFYSRYQIDRKTLTNIQSQLAARRSKAPAGDSNDERADMVSRGVPPEIIDG
jgi:Na+/melibiose symporter-like transporter